MTNTEVKELGWILGFGAGANWEITPMDEIKYDILGNCINGSRAFGPEHPAYQDPFEAFEKTFGKKFVIK